ncbi:MAG: hypothetical protein ABID04_04340 [Patescibacteria group bacterium]
MNKNKKPILIVAGIGIALLIVILTWLFGWGINKPKTESGSKKAIPTIPIVEEIKAEEMPDVELGLASDCSGGKLLISKIDSKFAFLEYELIYVAETEIGEIEKGLGSGEPIEIPGSRNISEDFIFGTESCTTGTCRRKIDKNISQGTVIITLIDKENKNYTFEKNFTLGKGCQVSWKE